MSLFTARDITKVALLLQAAARAEIMPRFRKLGPDGIRTKSGPLDVVTEADEAAERVITAALRRNFPGCLVVGEEAAAADPGVLDGLGAADLAFVVDPVDGTANYAAGLPLFGTMAAGLVRGEIVAAVIHDPVGDDTAFALRGEGAWIEAADGARQDLRVAPAVPVERMAGAASWRGFPGATRATIAGNLGRLAASWDYRCAAHEYRMLAAGSCHYLLFAKLMPWDHAPGWLLHREAGGHAALLDGSPYVPARRDTGLLCAPDRASWAALRDALLAR